MAVPHELTYYLSCIIRLLYKVSRDVRYKRQGKNCQGRERIGKIFLPIVGRGI